MLMEYGARTNKIRRRMPVAEAAVNRLYNSVLPTPDSQLQSILNRNQQQKITRKAKKVLDGY